MQINNVNYAKMNSDPNLIIQFPSKIDINSYFNSVEGVLEQLSECDILNTQDCKSSGRGHDEDFLEQISQRDIVNSECDLVNTQDCKKKWSWSR